MAKKKGLTRREFIQTTTAATTGLALSKIEKAEAQISNAGAFWRRKPTINYSVGQSLRIDWGNSSYLTRTSAGGNNTTATLSFWVKRSRLNTDQYFFDTSGTTDTTRFILIWNADDTFTVQGNATIWRKTSQVFRDTNSWYHVVVAWDTTRAMANDRIQIFVNGSLVTAFSTLNNPTQSNGIGVGYAGSWWLGRSAGGSYYSYNYLAEINFIDGLALDASSFGQINQTTGQWLPKNYSGSYGANGFCLKFADNSNTTATTLGKDSAPIAGAHTTANNWTPTNLQTHDQVLDSPTNNFSMMSHLDNYGGHTLSNGCLTVATNAVANDRHIFNTFAMKTGKWYWEVGVTAAGSINGRDYIHISDAIYTSTNVTGINHVRFSAGYTTADIYSSATVNTSSVGAVSANDVFCIALDADNGQIWISRSANVNTGATATVTGLPSSDYRFSIVENSSAEGRTNLINFGQGGQTGLTYHAGSGGRFKYTPPTGFKALCTKNLSNPTIAKPNEYFLPYLYKGNGGTQKIGTISRGSSSNHQISRSLRFNSTDTTYLARTLAAGNRQKWTFSAWLKRSGIGTFDTIMSAGDATNYFGIRFYNTDVLEIHDVQSATLQFQASTFQLFKNTTDFVHLVVAMDTTSSPTLKVYANGIQLNLQGTLPGGSATPVLNAATGHRIGGHMPGVGSTDYDGYMAEVHFIDNQALTPSSFGQADSVNGQWVAKAYSGSYGTNGFYLNFSDNSNTTATTLGKDTSGNNNDWTPSGFSVAAGAGNDSVTDTPTNTYCTLDPLGTGANFRTISNGQMDVTFTNAISSGCARGTYSIPCKGKWYFECTTNSNGDGATPAVGVASHATWQDNSNGNNFGRLYQGDGLKRSDTTNSAYGTSWSATNVIGIAIDMDNGAIYFARDNSWQNSGNPNSGASKTGAAFTDLLSSGLTWFPHVYGYNNQSLSLNFGQRPFAYTPPTGYQALNTYNIGGTATVWPRPDLIWIKDRTSANNHGIYDSSRGATKELVSNGTNTEATQNNGLIYLDSGQFEVSNASHLNTANNNYVGWVWEKGTTPGFDIVTHTGTGVARAVNHGLGVAPKLVITKRRDTAGNWMTWHSRLSGGTYVLSMNTTNAQQDLSTNYTAVPSSSQFFVGTNTDTNANGGTFVSYLWTEVPGFSRFGSYTGNGSADGPMVWCGFRPAWIMIKRIDAGSNWILQDNRRNSFNVSNASLYAQGTSSEDIATGYSFDFYSNGFKVRSSNADNNASGGTFIFIAFAEAPFKYALAR